jgi:hypothetical protein
MKGFLRSKSPKTDIFAIPRSSLNPFLFAEIDPGEHGCPVTVLSMMARQGVDGWAEAARLARLPVAAAVAALAGRLVLLPLLPEVARPHAARLATLLPSHGAKMLTPKAPLAEEVGWGPLAMLYGVLAVGLVLNVFWLPTPSPGPPATVCAADSPPDCAAARPQVAKQVGMPSWSPPFAGTP